MITMEDKYRFEDFGFFCEPGYEDPLTPNFERKTLSIPGRVGVWDFGVEIRERPLAYPLKIMDRLHGRMEYQFNLFKDFWFDAYGQPREVKIVRDIEPDKFYMVKLSAPLLPQRLEEEGNFTLPLVANYPYKQFIVQSDEVSWESDIPIISDITWLYGLDALEIKEPQTIEVHNDGTLIVRPKILISGSAESLTLTLNGESFSFGKITHPIEIDVEKYLVKVNGIESLSAMTGKLDKFYFLPGLNQIGITGSNLNLTMTIQFRNQYK